ncbi:hypothetical protein LTS08_002970 [Lithohypha guttulata]|nr:hypothetical protein LTS08_002970 [Lithohypha guttulata]
MSNNTENEEKPILLILQDRSHIETIESRNLRSQALDLVNTLEKPTAPAQSSLLPDTLLDLLSTIIKPLFSNSKSSRLTSTGLTRFASLYDEADSRPAWKNGWTDSLLLFVLRSYGRIGDGELRRKTLEAQFYLLVPAILHQLDDSEIGYKCLGCQCLELLCEALVEVRSAILRMSGLMDVFVDALRNDFSMLPTLTPEGDSLRLFRRMYPAFRSLVKARFVVVAEKERNRDKAEEEEEARQKYLTLLLRHQLLYALNHLSTGTGAGSTMSAALSTLFISQLGWIFQDMGIASVVHLQDILPLLRHVLCDPFAVSSPELLLQSIKAMHAIAHTCRPRIRDVWWGECLRAAVGCWLNVIDEEQDMKDFGAEAKLKGLKQELKAFTSSLKDIVRRHFEDTEKELLAEESELKNLFDGHIVDSLQPKRDKVLISEV